MRRFDLVLTLLLSAILATLLYRMWDARNTWQKEKVELALFEEMAELEAGDSYKCCAYVNSFVTDVS